MGVSYQQPCKNGYCWMCVDKGYVAGNGSAQVNPVPRKSALAADGVASPLWENMLRASENAS